MHLTGVLFPSPQNKLYKIKNLSDDDATLLEPAACAIHGLDKLQPPVGIEVLVLGAGPTGLILAQLLKLNGAFRVVIAPPMRFSPAHTDRSKCVRSSWGEEDRGEGAQMMRSYLMPIMREEQWLPDRGAQWITLGSQVRRPGDK